MVLHESGLWANLQLRPTDEHRGKRWQEELLLPSELAAASRRLGLSQAPTGPIHLMTADGLGGCQPTTPCLAFTAGTDRYLLRGGGELYRVTGPGRSLVDERGSAIELPALAPGDSVLVGVRRLPVERIGAH